MQAIGVGGRGAALKNRLTGRPRFSEIAYHVTFETSHPPCQPGRSHHLRLWCVARPSVRSAARYNPQGDTMKAEDLRALQAPLKKKYTDEPDAALITLRAEGRIGEGVTCRVETGKALVDAGLHPATGGDGMAACSGDMLLEALVACAGVTLNAVATAIGVELRDATVRAEGDLDFRGTLGVAREAPVGFREIRLDFDLDTDADPEQLATLLKLTERYCVVYQTLRGAPPVIVGHAVRGAAR